MVDITLSGEKDLMQKLQSLSSKDTIRAFEGALRKGAAIIRNQSASNLRRSVRITGTSRSSVKYGKIDKGIKVGRLKLKNDEAVLKVGILGDYRLKWIELGTKERATKKGYGRGSMPAKKFFAPAISSTAKKVEKTIAENLEKEINKRYYKIR